MYCIRTLRETGKQAEDRERKRGCKDWESMPTIAEMNESVEVINRVKWNCIIRLNFFNASSGADNKL